MRTAEMIRKTNETDIKLSFTILSTNTRGSFKGTSGIGFFDHMLNSFAVHGGFDLTLAMSGDLKVDGHHSVEDVGIVLGLAIAKAAGDKMGITRFADIHLPMDEALAFCAVDFSGRPFLVFDSEFSAPMIGDYDTQLTVEFFRALSQNAGVTLHLRSLYGANDHHITEALFKAAAKCFSRALAINGTEIPSAKGIL